MKVFIAAVLTVAAVLGSAAHVASAGLPSDERTPVVAPAPVSVLDAMASYVAGHPVHVVTTTDSDAWAAAIGAGALGYMYFDQPGTIYIGPYATLTLRYPQGGTFGGALRILAHEAIHARGVLDEGQAECQAAPYPRVLARLFYGVKSPQRLREIEYASQRIHSQTPPQYQTAC